MGDFLIDLVRLGRQVIVETHSENILLRVRNAVVMQKNGLTKEKVSVVHVGKTEDGESHTKQLDMDDLGQIKNWPKGFMEDATEERMILLEQMVNRQNKGENV